MSDPCPRCGTTNPTGRLGACPRCLFSAEPSPPATIGSLELLEEIGRGGMGEVWKARHTRLGRTVAVKFLPPELAEQEEFRSRFEREARALAMLNHPGIVAVHDFGQEDGRSFLVMEYVDGAPLSAKIPLPADRAVEIALQICDALDYAHRQGVVHRDIKPENILLDASGRAKVSDFGIARIVSGDSKRWTVTAPDVVVGTPHYMAPETLDGAPPDPRMDLYSLGVLLYHMTTGKLPVGDFDPLPGPLDSIVRKALSPDPGKRHATAAELRRELQRLSTASDVDDLPPDEKTWIRAVAILQSISTAVALESLLECTRPLILKAEEFQPLKMLLYETLADGRIVCRAHFETLPALATLFTFAVAITAYGFLRRHWRLSRLERKLPDRPIPESRWVLAIGVVTVLTYGARKWMESRGTVPSQFLPVLGGMIEIIVLFFVWVTILEAWRISRPLWREPGLWIGFVLALAPPAAELLRYQFAWKP